MEPPNPELPLQSLLEEGAWAARLARSLVGPERADDLLQETWVQALQSRPRGALSSGRAWLATLMRRSAARGFRGDERRRAREALVSREEALPPTESLISQEEKRRALVEAVLALPEALREPLVLRFFEELDAKAIAERLGLPASTVRSRLQRGLAELRGKLERAHGEDWRAWCLALVPASASTGGRLSGGLALSKATLTAIALGLVGAFWLGGELWRRGPQEPAEEVLVGAAGNGGKRAPRAPSAPAAAPAGARSPEALVAQAPGAAEATWLLPKEDTTFRVLRGLCLDGERQPVPGMRVRAANLRGAPSSVSGTDGRFCLPLTDLSQAAGLHGFERARALAPSVRVTFEGSGQRASPQRIELHTGTEIDLGLVSCVPASSTLAGRVLDSAELPAAGALLFLQRDFGDDAEYAAVLRWGIEMSWCLPLGAQGFEQTDPQGEFELANLPAGVWRVSVFSNGHDGFTSEPFELEAGAKLDLGTLELRPSPPVASLRGRLLSTEGKPVADAFVSARTSRDGWQSVSVTVPVLSDARGQFHLPVPPDSSCELQADSLEGRATSWRVAPGAEDLQLVLQAFSDHGDERPARLESAARLRGRVTHEGRGVENAWILSSAGSAEQRRASSEPFATARSGADGHFELPLPARGEVTVDAQLGPWSAPLFATWSREAPEGERGDLRADLVLRPGGVIAGLLLVPEAESMTGTEIELGAPGRPWRRTTIGADQRFFFHGVPAGSWQLRHSGDQRKQAAERQVLEVLVTSGETSDVLLELGGKHPARLVGSFLLDGERPRGRWHLSLSLDRRVAPGLDLGRDGSFASEPLERGSLRWQANWRGEYVQLFHETLELAVGDNHLEIDVPTGSLQLDQLPLPESVDLGGQMDVPCQLTWEDGEGLHWFAGLYRARQGRMTLRGVPAGRVQLRYAREGGNRSPELIPVVAEIEVRAGEVTEFACPPW